MWIDRHIEPLLLRRVATRPAILLTGARQTGKTSLMRRLFPEHAFVTLDLPSAASEAENEPASFLERHAPPVIIDEVQNAPGLFRYLKIAIDRNRNQYGQFLLTGSQPLQLMRSVSESLAGRVSIIELEPLSFAEAAAARPDLTVEDFLVRSGFPEVCANPQIDHRDYLQSYVATYLKRDLRESLMVSRLRDFERFLRALALRSAQLLNRADLARGVGISGSTAGSWLSVLEATHQVALLEPWFGSKTKSLVKRPKLFLRDAGLAASLCRVDSVESLRSSPLAGPLWETLVCAEIRRLQMNRRGRWDFNFWRNGSSEADFVLDRSGTFHLADAKWSEHPRSRDASALRKVAARFPQGRVASMSIICRAPHAFPLASDIRVLSLGELSDSQHWSGA